MLILKRPPYDNFTFRLFFKLTRQIKQPADIFYFWSAIIDPVNKFDFFQNGQWYHEDELIFREVFLENIKNNLVVIGVKDHLTSDTFNPQKEDCPNLVAYLIDMFNFYQDKTFILFTSMENLGCYVKNSNVFIVPWGGDITNQYDAYPKVAPVIDKNFDSNTSYISLNRNKRLNRILALSTLFGLGLEDYGMLSCMFDKKNLLTFENDIQLGFQEGSIKDTISRGLDRINNFDFPVQDDREIYPKKQNNDNVFNFETRLKDYYKNTFVEIIAETSFTEDAFLITEKTLNSIYGCNFPILISSKGAVGFLRNMGIDMFDDIVDHSYDDIVDPIERAYCAIEKNLNLLKNVDSTKELWAKNKDRFLKNVDFARIGLYKFYEKRAEAEFDKVINILNGGYNNVC